MAFARILSIINTTLLLTIVYIFLIGFAAIVILILRKDILSHRLNLSGTFWKPKEKVLHTLEQVHHQF